MATAALEREVGVDTSLCQKDTALSRKSAFSLSALMLLLLCVFAVDSSAQVFRWGGLRKGFSEGGGAGEPPSSRPDTLGEKAVVVSGISGENIRQNARDIGGKKLLGTFVLTQVRRDSAGEQPSLSIPLADSALVPFTLRLTFDNGGAFKRRSERGEREGAVERTIGLREASLRYRNRSAAVVERRLVPLSRNNRHVYECEFLREDVQAVYEMELWSAVEQNEAKNATGGTYGESILIETEVKR